MKPYNKTGATHTRTHKPFLLVIGLFNICKHSTINFNFKPNKKMFNYFRTFAINTFFDNCNFFKMKII